MDNYALSLQQLSLDAMIKDLENCNCKSKDQIEKKRASEHDRSARVTYQERRRKRWRCKSLRILAWTLNRDV